jgi:hypothetical protein
VVSCSFFLFLSVFFEVGAQLCCAKRFLIAFFFNVDAPYTFISFLFHCAVSSLAKNFFFYTENNIGWLVAAGESFYFLMNNKGIKNTLAV